MSAELTIDVSALRAELQQVSESFIEQTLVPIVREHAERMASDLRASYPRKTGNLANGVVVERGEHRLHWRVRNKSPHAHWFELGTVRRYTDDTGAFRGQMFSKDPNAKIGRNGVPARPIFGAAAVRWRALMWTRVEQAVRGLRLRSAA